MPLVAASLCGVALLLGPSGAAFVPKVNAVTGEQIKKVGAAGPKDMGKVMGALKSEFAGRMDFGKASTVVKGLLT